MSLKEKTVSGLTWSFIDNFTLLGISFIIGIILARFLSPKEYGLIGIITIFISISQSLIDSGFSQALLRKQNCTPVDYSTVFIFNITISTILYIILFYFSKNIGIFFHEPILENLIRILALGLIISSFSIIQSTQLTKRIDFKLQTKISLFSSISSGIISIYMAYSGWGVWSLVYSILIRNSITAIFLWFTSTWKPTFMFSINSFKELFSYGSKLLVSGLIDVTYRNLSTLVIGRYYTAVELGYYTRADQFQSLPSSNLQTIIGRVSLPVLLTIQNDIPRLKQAYRKLIKSTMFISFILMIGMAAIAKSLVLSLIGEKWELCVIYLQMLSFIGMLYPLHAINLGMLQVQGRSDLFLKLEVIKKTLGIPVILILFFFGIKAMIIALFLLNLIGLYLNSYWSGEMIGYSFKDQIKDIYPSLLFAIFINIPVFLLSFLTIFPPIVLLGIQLFCGLFLIMLFSEILKISEYIEIKKIIKDKTHHFFINIKLK
jgi:teichuronic acid exporter